MNVMQTGGAPIGKHCRNILLACDRDGYGLTLEIQDYLNENDVSYRMLGAFDDALEAAVAMCAAMQAEDTRAIVVAGDADAVCMCVNKLPGVRCVNADKPTRVVLGRRENDANMIALDYNATGFGVNMESVWKFITTDFEGGEFARRLHQWE